MPLPLFSQEKKTPLSLIGQIIAIAAGKGGVGKSAVTVNTALALQKQGKRVGILDADIYGPSIRKMLPEQRAPGQKNGKLIPAICQEGIRMMSMAYFRKEKEAAVLRAPIANGIIKQFIESIDWGKLDYLLIDFPPGTGDIQLTLGQQARLSGAIMVTTPQEVALMDVRKAMDLFDQLQVPLLGIVENMSYYQTSAERIYVFGKGGGERLSKERAIPLLGEVPLDPQISLCGDRGESLWDQQPLSAAALAFDSLAQHLFEQVESLGKKDKESLSNFKLTQIDKKTLRIEWPDGKIGHYRCSDLQKSCCCAGCLDEETKMRKPSAPSIEPDVEYLEIRPVGRYALRFKFSSGCSVGIFQLADLHASAQKP